MLFKYKPKPILMGTDFESDEDIWLLPEWLETHLHILGPPGMGKTRLLLWLYENLIKRPDATVIMLNPKGDLIRMARDAAINYGQSQRIIQFDPADNDNIIGYNPLRPNGLSVTMHAKAAREAIRSAWGQDSFDGTAQLARFLFLALCAARELELTLVEAVQILRTGSHVRAQMLARVTNVFVREALEYFDSLRESRQEELAASTLARLEAFVMDDTVRRIITQQAHNLDLGEVIDRKEILLVNLEEYKPLRPDDVRLLGRLIVNDVVSHVFSRKGERSPVFLIIDECHTFATQDLCNVLDKGRELGLHCILAHQHPGQLLKGDPDRLLYGSVTDCARTKIVFGGMSVEQLEKVAKDLFLCVFDPMKVKDEIMSLELEPVESVRAVPTLGVNANGTRSTTRSRTAARAEMNGTTNTEGGSDAIGSALGKVAGAATHTADGEVFGIGPDGAESPVGRQHSEGADKSSSNVETATDVHTDSWSRARQKATTNSLAEQTGHSVGNGFGLAVTVALTPFYEYVKRWRVSSRTFQTFDEFLIICMQLLKNQPKEHYVLKTPTARPVFLRAPYVRTPSISERVLIPALQRVFSRPCYATPLEIDEEESARRARLARMPERRTMEGRPHAAKSVRFKRDKTASKA